MTNFNQIVGLSRKLPLSHYVFNSVTYTMSLKRLKSARNGIDLMQLAMTQDVPVSSSTGFVL